ncbi:PAS domain S-box protein [Tumidithrix elongata RA019]|uniref:histidine kinase n=1 Tax=Tumidithrix elongata BACA0141 TaxID=2716417 RepID=A0AAW9Q6I5_9CYAN|nr:PAS domain S-box protein [Tumidithrix elongata RA019]
MNKQTILCVDDERNVLLSLRTQLLRRFPDCRVEIAESADEALELIDELLSEGVEIPLVISDQIMPGMKGDRLLIELHHRYPQILQVMLTGQASAEDVGNVVNQGNLYRFLAKPWNEIDLCLTVTEALRRYQQEQLLSQQQMALERANRELEAWNANLENLVQQRTEELQQEICHRQRIEENLQISEARNRATIAAIPDLLLRVKGDGTCLEFIPPLSDRADDFLPIASHLSEVLPPEQLQAELQALERVLTTGEVQTIEHQLLKEDKIAHEEVRVAACGADEFLLIVRDISDRKLQEIALQSLMEGTASVTGKDFFLCLAEKITVALDVSHVFIAKQVGESLETLAIYYDQQFQPNILYEIANTPCGYAMQQGIYYCPKDVQSCFPLDEALPKIGVESYLGLALKNALGETIGVLCILNRKPIANPKRAELLLKIFAARAAAEMERLQALESLQELNNQLEQRVQERTQELSQARNFLEAIIDNLPVALFVKDGRPEHFGKFLLWNNTSEIMFGCTKEQAIGKTVYDFFPKEQADFFYEKDCSSFEDGEVENIAEEPIDSLTLGRRLLHTIKVPLFDEMDNPQYLVCISEDITDQKRAEIALGESEAKFRRLVEGITDLIWSTDMEGLFTYLSPQFKQLFGWEAQAWLGKSLFPLIHPDDLKTIAANFEQILTSGEKLNAQEFRHLCQDGTHIWVSVNATPVKDADGKVVALQGILQDISDRKRTEKQLQSERLRLQLALEAAEMGTWESNLETGIWSERTEAIFGYAPGTFLGDREAFMKLVCVEDQEQVFQALSHSFATQSPYRVEYRINHLNGEKRWVAVNGKVVENEEGEEGEGRRIVGVALDITERKRAEEALRLSQEQLQLALDGSGDGLWDWNIPTGEVYLSPRWLRMLGYEVGELPAHVDTWAQLLYPDDRPHVMEVLNAHLQDDSISYQVEYRALSKTGEWKWFADYGKVVSRDADGKPLRMVGLQRDITQRKQVEDQIREQEQFLRSIYEGVNQPIFVTDVLPDQSVRVMGWNPVAEKFAGKTTAEVKGKSIEEIFIPEDVPAILQRYAQCIATKQSLSFEECINLQDRPLWTISTYNPLIDAEGEVYRIVGTVYDITDRKRAEEALSQSETKYRRIFDNSQVGIFRSRIEDGLILSANQHFVELIGYQSIDEVVGKNKTADFYSIDLRQQVLEHLRQFGHLNNFEFEFQQHGGKQCWGLVSLSLNIEEQCIDGVINDISDRKHTEAQLQEQEFFLRSIYNGTENPIFVIDATENGEFYYVGWNSATEKMSGLYANDVIGTTPIESFGIEQGNAFCENYRHCLEVGEAIQYEESFSFQGNIIWTLTTLNPLKHLDGNIYRIIGTAIDISSLKQTETALRESQQFIQSIAENTPNIIYIYDLSEQRNIYCNREVSSILGYTIDEIKAMGSNVLPSLVHPDDWAKVLEYQQTIAAAQDNQIIDQEYRMLHIDGSWRYLLDRASVFKRDPEGRVLQYIGAAQDVSDRKLAEAELRDSEERLRLALTAANQGLYDLNPQTGIAIVSPEYALMLGYDPSEFQETNAKWIERLHPDDIERVAATYQAYVRGELSDYKVEFRQRTKQGDWKWILSIGKVVAWDEAGQPLRMLGTHTDISDRKLTEEVLQAEQLRLNLALDAVQMATWSCNLQTGKLIWSDRAQEIFGFEPSTFPGDRETFIAMIHPEDYDRVIQAIAHTFETEDPYAIEYRIRRRDGEIAWVAVWGIITQDESSMERQLIGVVTDISDRKRAEAALRKSEVLLRRVFESNVAGMVFSNFDGQIVEANDRFLQMLGYSREDLQSGLPPWNEMTPPEHLAADIYAIEELTRTGEIKPWEKEYFRKDGSRIPVLIGAAFIEGSDPQTIAIVVDISDRKHAEEALRQANIDLEVRVEERTAELKQAKEAAEMANRAKSEFLANVSHELRTPLNGILGYTQILQNSTTLTDRDREGLGVIYRCGTHLLTLISDILDLAKIEAKKLELQVTELHLAPFLRDLIEICQISTQQKNVRFIYEAPFPLPREIFVDAKRLRQVLLNLLGNAIKFTDQGSITFSVEVLGQEQQLPDSGEEAWTEFTIRFTIADTGIGISPEQLKRIPLPFEQVGDIAHKSEGTGLGLAITHNLLTMMGATLEVQSQLGQGSVFGFILKVPATTAAIEENATTPQPKIIGFKGQPRKILVVDDKPDNRLIFLNLLQPLGFEMLEAESGQSGLDLAISWQPDLIVVDLSMPGMNGWELIRLLRQLPQGESLAIVLSSARVFESDRQRSLEMGANAFLEKPFQSAQLLEILQTHMNLEWIYTPIDRQKPFQQDTSGSDLALSIVPPSLEILNELMDLALKGMLNKLIDITVQLEASDPKLAPFASKLRSQAERFQIKEIRKFISFYRDQLT